MYKKQLGNLQLFQQVQRYALHAKKVSNKYHKVNYTDTSQQVFRSCVFQPQLRFNTISILNGYPGSLFDPGYSSAYLSIMRQTLGVGKNMSLT